MLDECILCEGTGIINEPPYCDGVIYCPDCGGSGDFDYPEVEED